MYVGTDMETKVFVEEHSELTLESADTDMEQPGVGKCEKRTGGNIQYECSQHSSSRREGWRSKSRKTNTSKMVRFQEPSEEESVMEWDSSAESLFPQYSLEDWTSTSFEELFADENWQDITEDRLLRKKVLEPGPHTAPKPTCGQEVTIKMQAVLEDETMVEKDCWLQFVIEEGDVSQALEECVLSMQKDEITLLLADSQYAYGLLGREPDIPSWAPLLYQLQLLSIQDKPDPVTLPIADRIRIGNQKRERGNFYFQREEYCQAIRAYCKGLEVLSPNSTESCGGEAVAEENEIRDYRVKCLNNLAMAQTKLEQYEEALRSSRDVLSLDPNNVKALFRTGKLLSDKGNYKEAMDMLKKALKLEPTTKAIHAELSKLVKRQSEGPDAKPLNPANARTEGIPPFLCPKKEETSGVSWMLLLGALMVALGSLVVSVILTACH